jgi:hypothetical protein
MSAESQYRSLCEELAVESCLEKLANIQAL